MMNIRKVVAKIIHGSAVVCGLILVSLVIYSASSFALSPVSLAFALIVSTVSLYSIITGVQKLRGRE